MLGLLALGIIFAVGALLGILFLLSLAAAVVVLVGGIQTLQGKSPRLLLARQLRLDRHPGAVPGHLRWPRVRASQFVSCWASSCRASIVFLLMQPQSKQYFASRGISY